MTDQLGDHSERIERLMADLKRCKPPHEVKPGVWRLDEQACRIAYEIRRRQRVMKDGR